MNKEEKNKVKKVIHDIEFYGTGLSSINGVYVEVTKVSVFEEEDIYLANISVVNQEEGTTTKYKDIEYSKEFIDNKLNK